MHESWFPRSWCTLTGWSAGGQTTSRKLVRATELDTWRKNAIVLLDLPYDGPNCCEKGRRTVAEPLNNATAERVSLAVSTRRSTVRQLRCGVALRDRLLRPSLS